MLRNVKTAPNRVNASSSDGAIRAKIGRPSTFSQAVAERICKGIAEGRSLRKVCAADGIPTVTTVMRWLITNEEFREHYRGAREIQADVLFDEQIDIADGATPETVHVARLRIDARKWVMGKQNAKKYGDKPGDVHVNTSVNNLIVLTEEKQRELQARRLKALEGIR